MITWYRCLFFLLLLFCFSNDLWISVFLFFFTKKSQCFDDFQKRRQKKCAKRRIIEFIFSSNIFPICGIYILRKICMVLGISGNNVCQKVYSRIENRIRKNWHDEWQWPMMNHDEDQWRWWWRLIIIGEEGKKKLWKFEMVLRAISQSSSMIRIFYDLWEHNLLIFFWTNSIKKMLVIFKKW